jgi:hypothetical protein
MEIKEAMAKITTELKNDTGYRESWKGKKRLNKEDVHIIANDAAEHFLKLLCDEYRASGDM